MPIIKSVIMNTLDGQERN